jgi:hypothetical protein
MNLYAFLNGSNSKKISKPCTEWLELIETMCNEILGNYTKKEDQLMTAAFGTREKRRLNRVMDALNFEYPDYDRLDEGAEGAKRKRIVSILTRQAIRSVKEDQRVVKKQKILAESKDSAPKKRKLIRISPAEAKVQDVPEKTVGPSPSSIDISKIMKVMTEPIPFAMLSPIGSDLTRLLQSKETASATGGNVRGQKKLRMMNVMQATEQTPPPASAEKTFVPAEAEDAAEAEANEATPEIDDLATTMSEIDRLISNVVSEKNVAEASTDKGKRTKETSSEDKNFDLRHLGGQQLSEEDMSELKDFAISCG